MVAAGAFSVGFGLLQELHHSRRDAYAAIGTLAGLSGVGMALQSDRCLVITT
jgi:poly(3-hydroxybutyrate) depolymerase